MTTPRPSDAHRSGCVPADVWEKTRQNLPHGLLASVGTQKLLCSGSRVGLHGLCRQLASSCHTHAAPEPQQPAGARIVVQGQHALEVGLRSRLQVSCFAWALCALSSWAAVEPQPCVTGSLSCAQILRALYLQERNCVLRLGVLRLGVHNEDLCHSATLQPSAAAPEVSCRGGTICCAAQRVVAWQGALSGLAPDCSRQCLDCSAQPLAHLRQRLHPLQAGVQSGWVA